LPDLFGVDQDWIVHFFISFLWLKPSLAGLVYTR
jgi:hypothetical protein